MSTFYSELCTNEGYSPCGTDYASFDKLKTVKGVVNRWKVGLKTNYKFIAQKWNITQLKVYKCGNNIFNDDTNKLVATIPINQLVKMGT